MSINVKDEPKLEQNPTPITPSKRVWYRSTWFAATVLGLCNFAAPGKDPLSPESLLVDQRISLKQSSLCCQVSGVSSSGVALLPSLPHFASVIAAHTDLAWILLFLLSSRFSPSPSRPDSPSLLDRRHEQFRCRWSEDSLARQRGQRPHVRADGCHGNPYSHARAVRWSTTRPCYRCGRLRSLRRRIVLQHLVRNPVVCALRCSPLWYLSR